MKKPREPKRRKLAPVEPPKPILQVMPGGRVRLDPTVIRELTAWVLAYSERYGKAARRTLRGLKGDERKRVLGERRSAESARTVLGMFAAGLTDTLDTRLVDGALRDWDGYESEPPPGPVTLPSATPAIPGTA